MSGRHTIALGLFALVATVAMIPIAPVYAQIKGDPARGEAKAATCVACHGAAGAAPLAGLPALAGQPAQYLQLQMILFREGLRDSPQMAPFMKPLSDADLDDLAVYFSRSAAPKSAGTRDSALHERGAVIAKRMSCGSCHLADYTGQQQIPRLALQREDYLFEAMKAYRENQRVGTDTSMNGVLNGVSDPDLRALSHYFAQF